VAMLTIASVAAFLASGPNPSWLNKDRNLGLLCKVLIVAGFVLKESSNSSSASSVPA
jgi:hypothetical protein